MKIIQKKREKELQLCNQNFFEVIKMRKCKKCEKDMFEGYVLDDGTDYFCSRSCLEEEITWEDYVEMNENGEAYWTVFD